MAGGVESAWGQLEVGPHDEVWRVTEVGPGDPFGEVAHRIPDAGEVDAGPGWRADARGVGRDAAARAGRPMAVGRMTPAVLDRVFDTVVLVVDLDARQALAAAKYDEAAGHFLNDGRLLVAQENEAGYLWAEAWELKLRAR